MMRKRHAPIALSGDEFRELGHRLVDQLAAFIDSIPSRPVTPGEPPSVVRSLLPAQSLPQTGSDPEQLLEEAAQLLFDHSLLNGHPKFAGYVTAPAAPLASLAELLAATVNVNLGLWILSPIATEIERQTISWIAELVSYPIDCGGVLVSGGNMANYIGLLVARHAKAGWTVRETGLRSPQGKTLRVYASAEAHTWLHKAADLFGLGTNQIHWIPVKDDQSMDIDALREAVEFDAAQSEQPFMVVGSAGTVSTGAVDPISTLREICDQYGLWLHIDGAYGAFAAAAPDCPDQLKNLALADSIAMDPHKWLYMPLEAGCALVKDVNLMRATFSYRPSYYRIDEARGEPTVDFVDYSPQNSRGFRALKVWLSLRQVGREGYAAMIADDMRLSRLLYQLADQHAELEAVTQHLSITTFRYVPLRMRDAAVLDEDYLYKLNEALVKELQESGNAFLSNAVVAGRYLLRACIVNFRTDVEHVKAIIDTVVQAGRQLDAKREA
jgi:aromatic-L-amino-acid decarboxylase